MATRIFRGGNKPRSVDGRAGLVSLVKNLTVIPHRPAKSFLVEYSLWNRLFESSTKWITPPPARRPLADLSDGTSTKKPAHRHAEWLNDNDNYRRFLRIFQQNKYRREGEQLKSKVETVLKIETKRINNTLSVFLLIRMNDNIWLEQLVGCIWHSQQPTLR